jgi:HPt (histidine-containing phosphotransfer) domain-containing protein
MSKTLNRYMIEKTLKKWDPLAQSAATPKSPSTKKENTTEPPATVRVKTSIEAPKPLQQEKKPINLKPAPEINQKWLSTQSLSEIKEFMGDEIVQLLEMFEQETPSILKKLNTALKSNNIGDIEKMAHMLKSTSANIGANGLSFFSRKMELAAKNKHKEQLPILFGKIKKSYTLTSKEIVKYINSQ